MKHLITILALFIITAFYSQNSKKDSDKLKTKIEQFSSQTGVITKFTDTNLSNLKASYAFAKTRIRKLNSGDIKRFFYQIEKSKKYGNTTASIEYTDLLEVIKALNILKSEVNNDITENPDYLENKFITEDGFQVGYYVSNGKVSWYLKLEKYDSDSTLFIKDLASIELSFKEAKNKIEELNNNQ